jgi:septal ring factor EnvC (AmiA/AmiB activator)
MYFLFSPDATYATSASEQSDHSQRLVQLRRQIEDITRKLNKDQKDHATIHKQLASIEKKISDLVQGNLKTEQRMAQLKADLISFEQQRKNLKRDLGGQQQVLAKQIRAEYTLGRHYPLKLMLTADDPKKLSRDMYYLHHYSKVSAQRLRKISADIVDIERLEAAIKKQTEQIEVSQKNYLEHKADLETQYQMRNALLEKLDSKIQKNQSALRQLHLDQQRLQNLVGSIRDASKDVKPVMLHPALPFAKRKGKLAWPVLKNTGMEKRGMGLVIMTEEGQAVYATAAGRIAYADWLRGYGLLTIVDHGDGYMTLYAYNQSLSKQINDTVAGGEIIALSGRSGGHPLAAVYFEVRHQGQTLDPLSWMMNARENP